MYREARREGLHEEARREELMRGSGVTSESSDRPRTAAAARADFDEGSWVGRPGVASSQPGSSREDPQPPREHLLQQHLLQPRLPEGEPPPSPTGEPWDGDEEVSDEEVSDEADEGAYHHDDEDDELTTVAQEGAFSWDAANGDDRVRTAERLS